MKLLASLIGFALFAQLAGAYEYPLQFTPNSGYRGLVVAGYSFSGTTVVGNCSYYTVQSGSGKGGGYHTTTTYYNQTCTWDMYGNLLGIAKGAPVVPAPISITGTQTVYAQKTNGDFTGSDTSLRYRGFVNTHGPHYSWTTPNAYTVLQQSLYTFTAVLKSDGDKPLNISAVGVSALHGTAAVQSNTCAGAGPLAFGMLCSVTVTYDPTKLRSATGLAYDTLDLGVVSDAGQGQDFIQSYTIVLKPVLD